jgi:hypothetical protein
MLCELKHKFYSNHYYLKFYHTKFLACRILFPCCMRYKCISYLNYCKYLRRYELSATQK